MAASTSYDSDHVGVRILDAALQLLRSGGPRAVTMQSVTEATGIAKKRCTGATGIGVRYLRPPWSDWHLNLSSTRRPAESSGYAEPSRSRSTWL